MDFKKKAHEAYWRLNDNYEGWPIKSLDVSIMAVNPKTNKVDGDRKKNTRIEYWLEAGPFYDDKKTLHSGFSYDPNLDCSGATFEEAIIRLEHLVKRHYGKKTSINGKRI